MSKESYVRGFCKAAEAAGVDPVSLIKYAQNGGAWFGDGPTVQRSWYDEGVAAAKNNPESVYRQIPGRVKLPTLGPVENPLQKNLDQQALDNHINNNFLDRPSFWRGFAGVKMPETQEEKNKFTKSVDMWRNLAAKKSFNMHGPNMMLKRRRNLAAKYFDMHEPDTMLKKSR